MKRWRIKFRQSGLWRTEFWKPNLTLRSLRLFSATSAVKSFEPQSAQRKAAECAEKNRNDCREGRYTLAAMLVLVLPICALAGPIVDRVVANVNGHVVLQSDWEEEVAYEAFEDGKDPASFTDAERKAALDRLIDQELLREQVRPSQPAPADQVAERVAEVRKLQPNASTEEGWHAALQRYGLTQGSLETRLSNQIQLMKLVEDRLRPSIHIDQQAVELYYHDQLLPELKKAGAQAKPLTEVYGRIKTLLAEQKLNELLTGWLANLRSEGHILTPNSKSGEQNR